MSNRLWTIKDWEERAHRAQYNVEELARQCEVPVRTLRQFLRQKFRVAVREWLQRLRMERAMARLVEGGRVNEVSREVNYGDTSQFTRAFKQHFGSAPSLHLKQINLKTADELR